MSARLVADLCPPCARLVPATMPSVLRPKSPQRSVSDDAASSSHSMTALRDDDGQAHDGPVTVRQSFRRSLVTTQLVRTGGGWRVAEQAIATEFEFAT